MSAAEESTPPGPAGTSPRVVDPRVRLAGTAAVTLVLGLAAGLMLGGQHAPAGLVELHVPGAMTISTFCDGVSTHGKGTTLRFLARDADCELEVELSPVMPLRGSLSVTEAGAYTCLRDGTVLHCSGPV